ncbi:MAG: peptide chain release factor N(5)-glutamine methyltransferase [Alphaproteobacteria bacterium]|nr:peptide chain release factor N(5)-glutamine methyltransferase [Alphaproteobacteria bacterium]
MVTLKELRSKAIRRLENAGCDTAVLDADLLISAALSLDRLDFILDPDRTVGAQEISAFEALVARRAKREPVALILGEKEFWGLDFKVSRDCLTPRPDSETLIEAALTSITDKKAALNILDLGTGSGCLLLSLMSELPNSSGMGVDISKKALILAKKNAERHGLITRCDFIQSDWAENLSPSLRFDIILCNPPYIAHTEAPSLSPDVRDYEPHGALFAGDDGLADYKKLVKILPGISRQGTNIFLEIGHTQGVAVTEIFSKNQAQNIRIIQDLAGRDRCVALNY